MRSLLRKNLYTVSIDKDFDGVISNCSKPRIDEEGAWLGPDMIQAYTELHKQGFAHSVEVWDKEGKLVGGLYGVVMGSIFIGESMFSLVPSGSKIALIALARTMKNIGGDFIDCPGSGLDAFRLEVYVVAHALDVGENLGDGCLSVFHGCLKLVSRLNEGLL